MAHQPTAQAVSGLPGRPQAVRTHARAGRGCGRWPSSLGSSPVATRTSTPGELRRFVSMRTDVEAVLQRCGREAYDLLLIDAQGNWTRWVFTSEESAVA